MMQTFVRPSRDLRNHYAEISEMILQCFFSSILTKSKS